MTQENLFTYGFEKPLSDEQKDLIKDTEGKIEIDEVKDLRQLKIKLRELKAKYQSVRDDYAVLMENLRENLKVKKDLRIEIKNFSQAVKILKGEEHEDK